MRRLLFTLFLLASPAWAESTALLPALSESEARAWPAIGRFGDVPGFCTGTLIAPDVVLTAGHCATNGPSKGDGLTFTAAPFEQSPVTARIIDGIRHPAYRLSGRHSPQFDIGLLFLERPLDIPPIPLAPPLKTAPETATIIGYHRDSPGTLTGRSDCPLLSQTAQLLFLGCRVISGHSGSPVLRQTEIGDWEIIAVTSSQSGPNAIAATLSGWITETLSDRPPSN